jgi:hypothetical protein
VYYFDCTRLGSGYASLRAPPDVIAKKYFISLLNDLGTQLLDTAIRMEMPPQGVQERVFDHLSVGLGSVMEPKPSSGNYESVFNYRQISDVLQRVILDLNPAGARLFVVLDEWAQIPLDAQPYVAEFLKRSILTVPQIALKILAVNYQCQFRVGDGQGLGLERGADITDVIDIDSYFVYDARTDFMIRFFAQVLYNHLAAELDWPLDIDASQKTWAVIGLFTQRPALEELVRAAEGNCRDFLCIFSKAYFEGFRQSLDVRGISIPHVRQGAATWYDSEKEANIRAETTAQETLSHILNNVLRGYKSRTFMVESSKVEHPRLIRLLNERVLHRLNIPYSHRDRPGERYELFTIDYGAYVKFKGTVNEPDENIFFFYDESTPEGQQEREKLHMVAFDDRRSIRRIIFDPERLETSH